MSVRFQRANFLVSDLDRALEFYCGVLGFTVAFQADSDPNSYSYDVFEIDQAKNPKMRWATLDAPGQERVMAVTEVPTLGPVEQPRRAAIVLDIADIDGLLERAKAGGFKVYREEELHTHDGRVGREVGVLDGDGNLSVIYNIPAAS